MPQDDSWWPETNGHDIGSQLVSRFEPIEDAQEDKQKDIEVGVEGKKFERQLTICTVPNDSYCF